MSAPVARHREVEAGLRWRPSGLTVALAGCTGIGLAAAVIGGRAELIAFVAPMLGVLCAAQWQRPVRGLILRAEPGVTRCFEDETVETGLAARPASDQVVVRLAATVSDGAELRATPTDEGDVVVRVGASRWGRYEVFAHVDAFANGGLFVARCSAKVADTLVFPIAAPQSTPIPRTELPDRLGTHLTRHVGPGVEYADVRPYVPGDQLRLVNWPVSARRRTLHVTERLTDRAADVIVLLDQYTQAPGPATLAIERAVRGAAQVVQSALQQGDRAGIVGLGSRTPRWLTADIGRRQFYRVLEAMLQASGDVETSTGTLVPRPAIPSGAVVVAFSTLLDTEFGLALIDLRRRGHTVVAVDVLEGAPFEAELDPLPARMWALERKAMYRDMGTVGVDVVSWASAVSLDQAMLLMPDHPRRRRVRR